MNLLTNQQYSKKGFRGFCLQTKEELEGTIIQELALEKDDFEVINGDPELYVPSQKGLLVCIIYTNKFFYEKLDFY